MNYRIGGVAKLGDVVVLLGGVVVRVVVPLFGTQVIATPEVAVGAAPAADAVPTCDGAGVTAVGCGAVGVGAVALVLTPVELDCGTVPAGQGVAPLAPSPPTVEVLAPGVTVVLAPGVVVAAPGEVPGSAVLFVPGVVVCAPGDVPGMAVLFMPGVTPGVVVWVPVGVLMVVPGVVAVGAVALGAVLVVVWPAVAGMVDVERLVWPAVAGAAGAAVPAVCAYAHVPPKRRRNRNVFRMRNPPPSRQTAA